MARLSRLNLPNIPQHVVQRGSNRQVFFFNETNYAVYLDKLKEYKALFESHIPDYTIKEIRDSLNKAWVLGDNRFKQQVEKQTGRRSSPFPNGGDRKSAQFKESQNNQLL